MSSNFGNAQFVAFGDLITIECNQRQIGPSQKVTDHIVRLIQEQESSSFYSVPLFIRKQSSKAPHQLEKTEIARPWC
jgi:hypothetical protein